MYHRTTLPNGLRVLVVPERGTSLAGVSVHYDVGFRSEPEGYTGFAHLFEHLMFQGSAQLPKLEHSRQVQGAGGEFNGSTHPDYTDFHNVLPASGLERALFCEADRMRAPALTQENLLNQVDVVKEEIRRNVLNRPYGGFPWIHLPPLLFESFANTHNGYGDFRDLERAGLDDCIAFFDAYYAPGNALVTVIGDVEAEAAVDLVHRHFGDIPARPLPQRVPVAEPPMIRNRQGTIEDRHAPMPALAIGYRLAEPYLASVVLSTVLGVGHTSRLVRRLIHDTAMVMDVNAGCGVFGRAYDTRDPDVLTITAVHSAAATAEDIVAVIDEELDHLADHGPSADELALVKARLTRQMHRDGDRIAARLLCYGASELLFGDPETVVGTPGRLRGIGEEEVAVAAKALRSGSRAVLRVEPTGGKGR